MTWTQQETRIHRLYTIDNEGQVKTILAGQTIKGRVWGFRHDETKVNKHKTEHMTTQGKQTRNRTGFNKISSIWEWWRLLCLDTILSRRSMDNSLDSMAWFSLWCTPSTVRPYIDRCALSLCACSLGFRHVAFVYEVTISEVEILERIMNKAGRKWLEVPHCLITVALYGKGILELPMTSLMEFKCAKTSLEITLSQSKDPVVEHCSNSKT